MHSYKTKITQNFLHLKDDEQTNYCIQQPNPSHQAIFELDGGAP